MAAEEPALTRPVDPDDIGKYAKFDGTDVVWDVPAGGGGGGTPGLVGDLSAIKIGDAATAGATGRYADAAHQHALAAPAAPAALGASALAGTATTAARADHVHPYPTAGQVLDGASLTTVTPATGDKMLLQDVSDSNKLKAATVASLLGEAVQTVASSGTTLGLDADGYDVFDITVDDDCTIGFTFTTGAVRTVQLLLTSDGGGDYTITLPGGSTYELSSSGQNVALLAQTVDGGATWLYWLVGAPSLTAGGGGGSSMLSYVEYNPGSDITLSTVSSTLVDADATNLAISFTAPDSGRVLVVLNGFARTSTSAGNVHWGVRDSSAIITGSEARMTASNSLSRWTYSKRFSGLTPGASYSWRWAHANVGGVTTDLRVGPSYGPATMQVWSA